MLMKTRLLILTIIAAILCGCGPMQYSVNSNRFSLGKATYISDYRVIQTIDSHFALLVNMRNATSPFVIALRTSKAFEPFYDGQYFRGTVVMVDTYSYETRPDEYYRTMNKTVPLVVPKSDYEIPQ